VKLYYANGELLKEMLTGNNGIALFEKLNAGDYFFVASKNLYTDYTSDVFSLKEGTTVPMEAYLKKPNVGYATAVIGNGVINIANGRQYPYDSTDTDPNNDYWKAALDFNTSSNVYINGVATLNRITVFNNVKVWDTLNPLRPGDTARFLQGERPGTLGENFSSIKFNRLFNGYADVDIQGPGGGLLASARMDSTPGKKEFLYNFDKNIFKNLADSDMVYRYNGSMYSTRVKETVGLIADAKVGLDGNVGIYMASGDFNYVVDFGTGIPAWESWQNHTQFTDGDNDNVMIPLFGSEYMVMNVDSISTTKRITLVKNTAKANYFEKQIIEDLEGRGTYAGQKMSVKFAAATITGAASTGYNGRFELYDAGGALIDTQTVGEGVYLNESFVDSSGNYALKTVVYIDAIGVEPTGV